MAERKPETAVEMLEAIEEFVRDLDPNFKEMPIEEVDAYLAEHGGFDADRVLDQALAAIESARGQRDLQRAREARLKAKLGARTGTATSADRETLISNIRSLVAGNRSAAVYARGLEKLSTSDLQSLLEDLGRLSEQSVEDEVD